ncbi:MAG: PaREP1 family protein [Pyrobaculum sp.]
MESIEPLLTLRGFPKPWRYPSKYVAARRRSAVSEALLAIKMLQSGYFRNAAAMAFLAFRSVVAARAGKIRDELNSVYSETRRIGPDVVRMGDILVAYVPVSAIRDLAERVGLGKHVLTALALYQFSFNGFDPEAVLSLYSRKEDVISDVCTIVKLVLEETQDVELMAEYEAYCEKQELRSALGGRA